ISLGDPVSLQPTNLSVSVWFKTSSIGDMRLVRKRTYGYILGMGASDLGASSGQVTFNIFDSASNQYKVTSTSTYNDGSWHHAVGTFDGNNVKLYIDGQLIGTVTAAVNIYYESDEITIGRDGGVSSRYFTGQMDELKIYNRALTEQEIIAQYNSIHGHMINMDPSTDWVEGAKQNPQQRALGKALDFDGSNDYVTVGNSITGVQSISLWIKPTNTTQSILDLDGGTHYLTLSSGSITANGSPVLLIMLMEYLAKQ
ncbi:MAG: LamG domain-containing protein, partial [Chitinophagales bacterium]|nr:LamG domain-containing protein [Chitinophagales bacterium]